MEQAVAVQEPQEPMTLVPAMNVATIKAQRNLVMEVMRDVMKRDVHYGKVPGTDSVALFKAGAEMLGMTFGLRAVFDAHPRELENGHREYMVDCTLTYRDGSVLATASGLCSSMESKYRWRNSKPACKTCGKDLRRSNDGSGYYCWKKKDGCGATFKLHEIRHVAGKVENPDIADQMNTVMKMAAKRAHVAGIRLALAVSDMFEMEPEFAQEEERVEPAAQQDHQKPKPTPEQELAHECAQLASKLGRDKDSLAELLKDGGGWAPKDKWTDLTLGELKKAREILAAEVALIGGAK